MKHATSRELYAYWNRLRRNRPAPRRGEIEPSDIRRLLADTFILEVADRDSFPVRLAGTRLCRLYCREIKSGDFLDLWRRNDREAVATLAAAVSVDAAAAVVTIEATTASSRGVTCEILLLPLRHNGPGYDRILGSFAPLEQPYWIGTDPIVHLSLTSFRLIWPDEQPTFLRRSSDRTGISQTIPFPVAHRRRGHLTLLEGGKE
jgi:hypothetical protein